MRKQKQKVLAVFLAALMLCLTALPASAATSDKATTMQLSKYTGTVNVTSSAGRTLSKRTNMLLYNGYQVETRAKSYAWINLDNTKLAKLDAVSKVEVRKSGKKLEVLLKSGHIFFNVSEPLDSDETLNVCTSTMIVGIRGTSGIINVIDRWATEIYILEGTVQCSATDPVTGQAKTETLHAGDRAIATAYPQDREGDKCDIILERFGAGDIDGFVLEELARDPGLCGDVYEETGMDILGSMGLLESIRRQLETVRDELDGIRERFENGDLSAEDAQARLDEFQRQLEEMRSQLEQADPDADVQRRLDEAQEHLRQAREALERARTRDAMDRLGDARDALEGARQDQAADARQKAEEDAQNRLEQDEQAMQDELDRIEDELAKQEHNVSSDPIWGDPPVESDPPAESDPPTGFRMYMTAKEVQDYLTANGAGPHTLQASPNGGAENLLTVPAGGSLTIPGGTTLNLDAGIDIVVESGGSLTVNGTLSGTGTLTNNGTLTVNSSNTLEMAIIINNGTFTVTKNGHIVAYDILSSSDTASSGIIEGGVTVQNGTFTMNGGTIDGGTSSAVIVGVGASFVMNGGEIISSDNWVTVSNDGQLKLNDGTIANNGSGRAVSAPLDDVVEIGIAMVIKAKREDIFAIGEQARLPEGYGSTGPDAQGYYYLTKIGTKTTPPIQSGDAGTGVTWSLYDDGVLTISGTTKAASGPFTDVSQTAWYGDAVRYMYENGLMSGTGGGKFSPDASASRGMIVTILFRMEGEPSVPGADFPDVPSGRWYTDAVAWASANEIVAGYDNGNFGPNDPVTREQMAAILYRYARYKGYDVTDSGNISAFPDGDRVSAYAADAMKWAVGAGLIQGSDGMLLPTGGATRAQAAVILMRFCRDVAGIRTMTVISAMDIMCEPSGILFLEDGSFLVTDTYNKVIWQVAGDSSTVYAGSDTVTDPFDRPVGGYNDAAPEDSYFKLPWAIVPFLDGYAVSDSDNNVVRLVRAKTIQTINGSTRESLTVTDLGVTFDHPTGLAADEKGNLYVSDTFNGAVRKITPEGNVTTFVKGLSDPMGLCWKDGTLYIAETGANRIVKTAGGGVTVVAGSGEDDYADGPSNKAAFSAPQGVAVGDDGTVYVADTVNGAVRQIRDGEVTTLAIRDESDLNSFIPASPVGLAVRGNRLYVCDSFARRIFVISPV